MKVCKKCEKYISFSEFYEHKTNRDGYSGSCKKCIYEQHTLWRLNHPGRWSSYGKNHREKHPDYIAKVKRNKESARLLRKEYSKRNPEKELARSIIGGMIKSGKLVRPNKCSQCLKELFTEAHHPDHSQPLNIIWLCKKCHSSRERTPIKNKIEPLFERKRGLTRPCEYCGKIFYRPPSLNNQRCCSTLCSARLRVLNGQREL